MVKRPTIADLARRAGVSVATVDRVLNGRLPVREETARRVLEASTAVGYHASGLIRQRLQRDLPDYPLGFLLLSKATPFYQAFAREIARAVAEAPDFRGRAIVEHLETQAPVEAAARLRAVGGRSRAVAMVAVDHPTITAAVADLKERGVPTFALLSDFAAGMRESYVGLNNRKVGRTAGWAIAHAACRPGKVALFVGSHRFHGHEMREIGFRTYLREHAPQFEVLDTLVNLEDPRLAEAATLELLRRHPDLVGLYVAGGGMEGAIAALRAEGAAGRVSAVCSELTAGSRAALADAVITMAIATPLERLCRDLVGQMARAIQAGAAAVPGQTFLPFDIFVSENI